MIRRVLVSAAVLTCLCPMAEAATTNPYTYSKQLTLMGLTTSLQASAFNGAGVVIGDIDTGIESQWIGFSSPDNTALLPGTSNVDFVNSAQCLGGSCPVSGAFPTDFHGHGTFTASEMVGGIQSFGLYSVAPAASLLAVQVLEANGSGTSNDIYNGIVYAVDHGAHVLNLSLGPSGSAAQQTAFYNSIAGAVNYAASKGAIIVFAGGNSAQNFAGGGTIKGWTDQAIAHTMLVGSTNASKVLSSFSNRPGSAGFISTTGKKVLYDTIWVMADGEKIWGASNYSTPEYGYSYITQMSGTSMAAPQASGLAGLIAARWPYLIAQGTIPQIIQKSATDLGTKGIDVKYGRGFLNATKAFQPIGTTSVPTSSGTVTLASGSISTSRALGDMGGVSRALSHASLYDSFGRDFSTNLGAGIATHSSRVPLSPSTIHVTQGGSSSRSFIENPDGSWFAFSGTPGAPQWGVDITQTPGFTQDPTRPAQKEWSMAFQQKDGIYAGAGQGTGAAMAFNDARWGGRTAFFNNDTAMGGTLLGLTDNASYSSVGFNSGRTEHISLGVMSTAERDYTSASGQEASAYGAAAGYAIHPSDKWTFSWTTSYLDEKNMLLGSAGSGYLGLGQASTVSFGMGANVELGEGFDLGLDTIFATTNASGEQDSLISNPSRLYSAGFSIALNKQNLTGIGDTLGLSVRKPLRVYSGSADVTVPSGTDTSGNPVVQTVRAALTPSGNETDFGVDYIRPLTYKSSLSFSMSYRDDADNIAGETDGAVMMRYKLKF